MFPDNASEVKTQLLAMGFEEIQIEGAIALTNSDDMEVLIDTILGKWDLYFQEYIIEKRYFNYKNI